MPAFEAGCPDVIQNALAGDARSFDALACLLRRRVYSYLRRLALDEHNADDLTQDTLLAVLKSMGGVRRHDRFWPWVYAIAANSLRKHYRSQAARRTTSASELALDSMQLGSGSGEDSLDQLLKKESAERTRKAMQRIGKRDRAILLLRFCDDMPHAGIARLLGCSELTARVWLCHAKHALRQALSSLESN